MEDTPPSESPETSGRRLTPLHADGTRAPAAKPGLSKVTDPDLATKTADIVDSVVDVVRTKVVNPVERVAAYLVLTIFSAFAGAVLLVLLCVGLFRLLMMLLNIIPGGPHEWAAYAIMGGIFLVAGLFLNRKRRNVTAPSNEDS